MAMGTRLETERIKKFGITGEEDRKIVEIIRECSN